MKTIIFLTVAAVLWAVLGFVMQPIRSMSAAAQHAAGIAAEVTR
jgi:hypothetical protein